MCGKVAVVTGSNKGIGFAIVRELLRRKVDVVYLTSRDEKRGKEALEELKKEGLTAAFHQLEVTNTESVKRFADHLRNEHGGLDILINNAGVIVSDFYNTTYEDAKFVIDVNYRSILTIQKYIFPILRNNARVINVSSDCGHLSNLRNKYWIERLSNKNLVLDDIEAFIDWFLDCAKKGNINDEDFAETPILAYRISKIALCALTIIQQREVGRNISVNSMHPGFVKTNMTRELGQLTMEQAGKTPVYLALDAPQELKGSYIWFDKRVLNWYDVKADYYCHFETFGNLLKESGHI